MRAIKHMWKQRKVTDKAQSGSGVEWSMQKWCDLKAETYEIQNSDEQVIACPLVSKESTLYTRFLNYL